jgi:hypothetical protein
MHDLALIFAALTLALAAVAGGLGAAGWWRVEPTRAFWIVLRVAQLAALLQAGAAAVLAVAGYQPADGLYWLYAGLPVAIGIVAEQVRAMSAQTVLDSCGLASARDVGKLDDAGQRAVVAAIMRRETGVMTLAAWVVVFLALRALGTA